MFLINNYINLYNKVNQKNSVILMVINTVIKGIKISVYC